MTVSMTIIPHIPFKYLNILHEKCLLFYALALRNILPLSLYYQYHCNSDQNYNSTRNRSCDNNFLCPILLNTFWFIKSTCLSVHCLLISLRICWWWSGCTFGQFWRCISWRGMFRWCNIRINDIKFEWRQRFIFLFNIVRCFGILIRRQNANWFFI